MSKIKQEEYLDWKSIIPNLKKNINQCLKQVKDKQIQISPPDDFQLKKNKIKFMIEDGQNFDDQQYLDVFAFMLDEKINCSQNQLIDQFIKDFGKDHQFWRIRINKWANQVMFTTSLVIWTVQPYVRNYVNYITGINQRDFIYTWRGRTQAYVSSIQFLMKKIQKLTKKDGPYSIDDAYTKYHKEKQIYKAYNCAMGLNSFDNSKNYFDDNTITFQNKSKAEKKLFNFPHATKPLDQIRSFGLNKSRIQQKKSANTLDKYFGKIGQQKKYAAQQIEVPTDQQQKRIDHQNFVRILEKIGKQEFDAIYNLQRKFKQQGQLQKQQWKRKQSQQQQQQLMKTSKKSTHKKLQPIKDKLLQLESVQNGQFKEYFLNHLTFIHNPLDFYWHVGFPVAKRNIDISNPFILYPWVNYYINDEQEYEQMMALSLDDQMLLASNDSSDQDEDEISEQSNVMDDDDFIDKRKFITRDGIDENNLAPQDRMEFSLIVKNDNDQWIANYKNPQVKQGPPIQNHRFDGYHIIPIYDQQLPYSIEMLEIQKSKKAQKSLKTKGLQKNITNSTRYQIQQIIQTSQEDNSTTNNFNSRQQRLQVIQAIQQNVKEQVNSEKNNSIANDETVFEQRIEQNINQNQQYAKQNQENLAQKMEVYEPFQEQNKYIQKNEQIPEKQLKTEKRQIQIQRQYQHIVSVSKINNCSQLIDQNNDKKQFPKNIKSNNKNKSSNKKNRQSNKKISSAKKRTKQSTIKKEQTNNEQQKQINNKPTDIQI